MPNQPTSPPPGSVPGSFSPGDMGGMDLDSLKDQFSQSQGGSQANSASGLGGLPGGAGQAISNKIAKPIGQTIPQELGNLGETFGQQVTDFIPDIIKQILGIKKTDSPEEKAKKQQLFQNYQKLNAEDQAYAQKKLQQEQARKQQQQQEDQMRKQRAQAEADSNEISAPQGKKTGAGSDGNTSKSRTTNLLNKNRQQLSSAD